MIGRIWRGETRPEDAVAYVDVLKQTGLADYRAAQGNRGVIVLRRVSGQTAEFVLLTLWEDWDSLTAFAGDDPEQARYYPQDESYLTSRPEKVENYQVIFEQFG
jgi:heme-degrading monooxygenase HmoA